MTATETGIEQIINETYPPGSGSRRRLEAGAAAANEPLEAAALRQAVIACRLLGRVVTENARAMEAARIELAQGDPRKAMEWILNSLPDVDDNDPADQWNGTETAQEWFDRTDERNQP